MLSKKTSLIIAIFTWISIIGCTSETKDLLDLALDAPGREAIDTDRMGVNNFFVNSQFGSISTQYSDIKSNIKLN